MIEVNIIDAVSIQRKINEEVQFLNRIIQEAPDGAKGELELLLDKRKNELISIDDGIGKAILLIPQTTSRFIEGVPIIVKEEIIIEKEL